MSSYAGLLVAIVSTVCCQAEIQTSFWLTSTIPATRHVTNTAPVTVGLKFYSDVPGLVTGVRFYKGTGNTGMHTGALWSSTGARLATVTFSGETASGWQQANFSSPITIAANTTYVVSYTAPTGGHAHDQYYPWSSLSSGPLHVSGASPGVFTYGSGVLFPASTWNSSNYYVDVVFTPAATTQAPATQAPATGQTSFWTSTTPYKPQVVASAASVTLGLKFHSDVPGFVTGVRFYKAAGNTGTHVGTLWSGAGAKLASVTFSRETSSGWQQAAFSTPINIAAKTVYVISYTEPNGGHILTQKYAWSKLSAAPLRVSGTSPGVHTYGSGTLFPTSTWNGSNYWVDVVFAGATSAPSPPAATYTISGKVSGSSATVTLSGPVSASTTTDALGDFSFAGLTNGLYVVAPSQSGYVFTPITAVVSINGASITQLSFTAAALPVSVPHSVLLSWLPSISLNIRGYNVYRGTVSGGPYIKLNGSPMPLPTYTDAGVTSGRTYYYVATAVDWSNRESAYSNQAKAVVPVP